MCIINNNNNILVAFVLFVYFFSNVLAKYRGIHQIIPKQLCDVNLNHSNCCDVLTDKHYFMWTSKPTFTIVAPVTCCNRAYQAITSLIHVPQSVFVIIRIVLCFDEEG